MEAERHDDVQPIAAGTETAPAERIDPDPVPEVRRSGLLAAFLAGVLLLLTGCVVLLLIAADRAPG